MARNDDPRSSDAGNPQPALLNAKGVKHVVKSIQNENNEDTFFQNPL